MIALVDELVRPSSAGSTGDLVILAMCLLDVAGSFITPNSAEEGWLEVRDGGRKQERCRRQRCSREGGEQMFYGMWWGTLPRPISLLDNS